MGGWKVKKIHVDEIIVAVNISCHATRHKEARLEGRNE